MPSKAYSTFLKNYEQVNKMKQAYEDELHRNRNRGKRSLDHYTRAAIMFLCSSFEVYYETVLEESCTIVSKSLRRPSQLPKQVRKSIARYIDNSKNELEVISFADNWKQYYINLVKEDMSKLNTPKMSKIRNYVSKYLGFNDIFDTSVYPFAGVDDIISERGEIAHNVFGSSYIKEAKLIEYSDTIKDAVKEIDLILYNEIPKITRKKPWNNTY
jgi:hypothetical protein